MGYTSKQIDEEIYKHDLELILYLDADYTKKEMKKQAVAIAMALSGKMDI